jgi:hypothetical protein
MKRNKAGTHLYFADACRENSIDAWLQRQPTGDPLVGGAQIYNNVAASGVYYAAADGSKAFGPETDVTYFASALLEALEGAANFNRDGQRRVDTSSLGHALAEIMASLASRHKRRLTCKVELEGLPTAIHFPANSFVPVTAMTWPFEVARILEYAPEDLVGRRAETQLLDRAWSPLENEARNRPRVLIFVAWGGEGKTALVAKWVARLKLQEWLGCVSAFAWSFQSQGMREQVETCSDSFLKAALAFFGDDEDKKFAASEALASAKGKRLSRSAEVISQH